MKHTITAAMLDALKDADKVEQIWLAEFQYTLAETLLVNGREDAGLSLLRESDATLAGITGDAEQEAVERMLDRNRRTLEQALTAR